MDRIIGWPSYWLLSWVTFILMQETGSEFRTWKYDRQPNISHRQMSLSQIQTDRPQIQRLIVRIHNHFRSRVDPTASNMLEMSWDDEAAQDAERWSNECLVLQHDNTTGRWVDKFGSCGQNIFISSELVPWLFAVETWWLEKDLFQYGNDSNNLHAIGHYTQLVWASTHRVGCGVNQCTMVEKDKNGKVLTRNKKYFLYVCNYCPIGNFMDRLGLPYQKGAPCSSCKSHCNNLNNPIGRAKSFETDMRNKNIRHGRGAKSFHRVGQTKASKAKYNMRKNRRSSSWRRHRGRRGRSSSRNRILRGRFKSKKSRVRRRRHKKYASKHRSPIAIPRHEGHPLSSSVIGKKSDSESPQGLCTNSCPVADQWVNCRELAKAWRAWLCHEKGTKKGRERWANCKATCICHGKITN